MNDTKLILDPLLIEAAEKMAKEQNISVEHVLSVWCVCGYELWLATQIHGQKMLDKQNEATTEMKQAIEISRIIDSAKSLLLEHTENFAPAAINNNMDTDPTIESDFDFLGQTVLGAPQVVKLTDQNLDKRLHRRVVRSGSVRLSTTTTGAKLVFKGVLKDLSQLGCSIEMTSREESELRNFLGCEVDIEIFLTEKPAMFTDLRGQIVQAICELNTKTNSKTNCKVGVRFVNLTGMTQNRLIKIVA